MKKILKMIEEAKVSEEKIISEILKKLEKNKVLKEKMKLVENCNEDECYLRSNDIDGVDYVIDFSLSELGLEIPDEYLVQALDEYLEATGVHYSRKNKELSMSTADEIFLLTHDKMILLPNEERDKYYDDFHAWLIAEDYMETSGYYPGIYTSDYWGNVGTHKWDRKYRDCFAGDETKKKRDQLAEFLSFYEIKKALDEGGYNYHLDSLPERVYSLLSQELKDLHFNDLVRIEEIKEITPENLVFTVELGENELKNTSAKLVDARYGIYEIDLALTPNAIRFILEDEKPEGGLLEMSLLSVG